MITLLAVFAVLDTSVKQSSGVAGRVNATQRARLAMDAITRQVRSQICINSTTPAILSGTADSVKFHADLTDGARPVEQREIIFNPTAGTLTENTWAGVVARGSHHLADDDAHAAAARRSDAPPRAAPARPAGSDFFHYYAYSVADPPRPTVLLTTPLNATDRARVAKVELGFTTLPPGARPTSAASVTLQNEVYVRVADPNDPAPTPTCV